MKKEILVIIAAFFLLSLTAITGVYAIEKDSVVTISENKADVTGDGVNETIYLKGIPYEDEDSYLKTVYVEVGGPDEKMVKIPLESGSKASLQLVDVNHDGVKDLFASVQTGDSSGTIYFLSTLKDFKNTPLQVPAPLEVESRFLNGYKAEIKIEETGKTYQFNLKDRKKYYKNLGLYYNGMLNESTELTVNPFSTLKPTLINGVMGLKGIQVVTGIANADTIADIESLWLFKGGKWSLVTTKVQTEIQSN